jgi:hypothetical protein
MAGRPLFVYTDPINRAGEPAERRLHPIGGGSTQFVVVSMNPSTGSDLDAGSDLEPVPAPTLEPLGSESEEEVIEEVGSRSDFK